MPRSRSIQLAVTAERLLEAKGNRRGVPGLTKGQPTGRLKTGFGRELPGDQLIAKLHGAVPRVPLHAVLLEGKLLRLIEIKSLPGLPAGRDVDVVQREHIGFQAADVGRPDGLNRRYFGPFGLYRRQRLPGKEKQQTPAGRQRELGP